MVQNIRYSNGLPILVTLPFEYTHTVQYSGVWYLDGYRTEHCNNRTFQLKASMLVFYFFNSYSLNDKIRHGSRNFGRQSPRSRNLPYLVKIAITNTNTKIRIRIITF